jgi:energy-coupling factor transporter ATP-binding protein EcfA2
MSRTPSMDAGEAEQLLGLRGNLRVTIENRGTVRKWLTARGLPSPAVGLLSMAELELAYNDASDQKFRSLQSAVPAAWEVAPAPAPVPPVTVPVPAPASPDTAALGSTLAAIIGPYLADQLTAKVDESRVIELMRTHLADLIPVTRVEIRQGAVVRDMGQQIVHKVFPEVVRRIGRGEHVYLVGPAGCGKTKLAEMVFEALDLQFGVQGAPEGSFSFVGHMDAHGTYHRTPFRDCFEHGRGLLLDELDGALDAAPILKVNSALANGYMEYPDSPTPVKRHDNFRCIAACNTYGVGPDRVYVGRVQLDASTLDRFSFVEMDYDENLERKLAGDQQKWCDRVHAIRKGARVEKARMIVSTRAIMVGAVAIASGDSMPDTEDALIWRGCDKDLRRRIETWAAGF